MQKILGAGLGPAPLGLGKDQKDIKDQKDGKDYQDGEEDQSEHVRQVEATISMSARHPGFLVGLALLVPATGWAHSLCPSYYPLGPLPIWVCLEWWPYLVSIPLSVALTALVLRRGMPAFRLSGHFWRAGVLYLVARAGETGAIFLLSFFSFFRGAGWSSSNTQNLGPLAVFLAAGLVLALPAGLGLYRRTGARSGRILVVTAMASLAAYLAAFGFFFLATWIRGY